MFAAINASATIAKTAASLPRLVEKSQVRRRPAFLGGHERSTMARQSMIGYTPLAFATIDQRLANESQTQ
jgi:hypothetical protein